MGVEEGRLGARHTLALTFLQLLWDLELLTGAGMGLFRAPWTQFGGWRDQAQHAWSQHSQPSTRMGRDFEQLVSGHCVTLGWLWR